MQGGKLEGVSAASTMAENGEGIVGGEGGGGVDFNLPSEVLAVIPVDPYDQLDLARKITSMAISSRVSKLEMEASRFRQRLADKDRTIEDLQGRVAELERMVRDADSSLRAAIDDNVKLSRERDALAATVRKTTRDLAKLETFKKQLMQSLSEENSPLPPSIVDIGTCEQSIPRGTAWKDAEQLGYTCKNLGGSMETSLGVAGQSYWPTYVTQRLTPTVTPKVASTSNSPCGLSTAGSPKRKSGATSPAEPPLSGVTSPVKHHISASPTKAHVEAKSAISPWYPSSIRSSAANSPPRTHSSQGRSARIDGREFFRQARSRLTYEQFAAFLENIKELNAHRQSRDATLKKAEEIFGIDNRDLYLSFQSLLNRNVH